MDSYVGTHSFSGQEIIWYNSKPVWSMNYYGDVLSSDFKSSFLKSALMFPSLELPCRGKHSIVRMITHILWKLMVSSISFRVQKNLFKDLLTYELFFHGGKIIDNHFDYLG
ncbi:DUF5680 domain-containing protein [Enterococcus termitis]